MQVVIMHQLNSQNLYPSKAIQMEHTKIYQEYPYVCSNSYGQKTNLINVLVRHQPGFIALPNSKIALLMKAKEGIEAQMTTDLTINRIKVNPKYNYEAG